MAKTAIVTGATRGIGRASALALARLGYDVAITGRTQNEGDAAKRPEAEALPELKLVSGSLASTAARSSMRASAGAGAKQLRNASEKLHSTNSLDEGECLRHLRWNVQRRALAAIRGLLQCLHGPVNASACRRVSGTRVSQRSIGAARRRMNP